MQVLFSNPLVYAIEYSAYGAIELLDRRTGKVGLIVGEDAIRFRHEIDDLVSNDAEKSAFEDFLNGYGDVVFRTVVRH